MKNETIFIKLEQSVEVYEKQVRLKDVASFYCSSQDLIKKLDEKVILIMNPEKADVEVISALKIFKAVQKLVPEAELSHIGEPDVLIRYVKKEKTKTWLKWLKLVLVCLGTFVGSAFSIMTFNTDVSVSDVFDHIYELFDAVAVRGYKIVEISYSVGLFAGIMIFYNHYKTKRKWSDPTPIQVEMRNYDSDSNGAIIAEAGRTGREKE